MDGIHDLGGKHGYGPVGPSAGERVFRERWEALVFAMVNAAGAAGIIHNTDHFRHAIERIDPVVYLTEGYYGRWLAALELLAREADRPAAAAPDAPPAHAARPLERAPRFAVGESVRTGPWPVSGHTRLPAYARGRAGTIVAWHGAWVYPDSNAHGRGEDPQHLYTVSFTGEALWGGEAEPGTRIRLDLFEPYLEVS